MKLTDTGGASYLTAEKMAHQLHGVRVYVDRVDEADVLFICRDDPEWKPGNARLFLMVCPECRDAFWYTPGSEATEKVRECCWPATERARLKRPPVKKYGTALT